MPFYPMRPATGRVLRNKSSINDLIAEAYPKDSPWLVQPKMDGDRACLATYDGHIYIQNRHGGWFKQKVSNAADFKKLPDRTVQIGRASCRERVCQYV